MATKPLDPNQIFQDLEKFRARSKVRSAEPNKGIEDEIRDVYAQASKHREWLLKFYIMYTTLLSISVISLIFLQAKVRLIEGNSNLELIPQWALNLIVTGMFGQFIGLLTIVTKRVWEYKQFFDHAEKHDTKQKYAKK